MEGMVMSYIPGQLLSQSSFGDTVNADMDVRLSLKATYGILEECESFSATGGSVTTANNEFVLTTGTSVGGYGLLWSRRPMVYVPGVGAEARITARFTTGVANSQQGVGLFSSTDGMIFGYNGTSFGVMHRLNGALELQTLTVTAGSGGAATVTVTLNGVAYTAAITSGTADFNAHQIEQALNAGAAGTLWNIQHVGTTVVFLYKGVGSKAGTYSVSVSAGTFTATIARNRAGATPTENWTARASWNVDTCSWLDPTKGNLYKFEYAYLGYGPLKFSVFHPTQRKWVLAHVVDWPNAYTGTNLGNPSLRVGWFAASLGSTTNLTVAGASAMAMQQGTARRTRTFSSFGTATGVTTETQVLSLQSRREFGNRANNGIVRPTLMSIATDSTKGAIFTLYRNATVAGSTVHNYVNKNESCCAVDTAGTTITGGNVIGIFTIGPTGRATIDLSVINEPFGAGEELAISAKVTSGAASEMTCALVWDEYL